MLHYFRDYDFYLMMMSLEKLFLPVQIYLILMFNLTEQIYPSFIFVIFILFYQIV